ncbi:MAG: modifier of protease [Alphaproteobacteria bacterium]|nr:modifier of protease [Alphaproteobacteria bacterium]
MNLGEVDPAWFWLVAAAALAAIELVTPGFFLIWIAGAAMLTGVAAFLLPIDLAFQLVLFGLFSILAVILGRRHYERSAGTGGDPLLNDRTAQLIGQVVTVVVAIENGEGRVRVGDSVWSASGPDVAAGSRVRIHGADGNRLKVAPLPAPAIEN